MNGLHELLCNLPTLTEDIEDAFRVTQDSDDACLYGAIFARLLEAAKLQDQGSNDDDVKTLASALLNEGDAFRQFRRVRATKAAEAPAAAAAAAA